MSSFTPADRVPARTDADAKRRLLGVLSRSLSTVSGTAQWKVGPRAGANVAFTVPSTVGMRTEDGTIFLRSTIEFSYAEDLRFGAPERKASTHGYAHTLAEAESLKPQLFSWEWAAAEPTYPHLHIRRSGAGFEGLGKLHIPTGRVFYEAVLLFAIAELGVVPARPDWRDILSEAFRRVSSFATWGGGAEPQHGSSSRAAPGE